MGALIFGVIGYILLLKALYCDFFFIIHLFKKCFVIILDLGLSEGILCNQPCSYVRPSVCLLVCPSLNISETIH